MHRYFSKRPRNSVESSSALNNSSIPIPSNNASANDDDQNGGKKSRIELTEDEIIGDPGLRKPIDSYPVEIRDEMRRRYVTKGPCQPYDHVFPKTKFSGIMRSFRSAWFKEFDWLEYSVSKDAAFCLMCYLFPRGHKNGDVVFTHIGFKNWKKGVEKFREHEGTNCSIHHYAREQYLGFKNQRHNVDYVLSQQSKEMETVYRIRLTAILDTTRFLLRQGLAFRGNNEHEDSMQRGNFLELLKYRCDFDERVSKVMNSNAPGNNQLTSPTIQKEIVSACALEVRKVIVNEIGNKYFSLLIDEARDSSIKEQMAIVLRFVNDHGEVVERFFGVVHVTDTSAQSLKNAIDEFFAKNGLSMSKIRGQGYDGASNMRGEINGLKQKILDENKQAHYVHCFAHRLQLVVVSASKEHGKVGSFFDHLVQIVNVVGASCKRKDVLLQKYHENLVKRIESGEISKGKGKNQGKSLVRSGDTRWGSHYKTISRVIDMWHAVTSVLEVIYVDATDKSSKSIASGLNDIMMTFDFVFIAHLMLNILGKTNALSKILQEKNQNIGNAMVFVGTVKSDLVKYRDDDGWNDLLGIVTTFCSQHHIVIPNMEDAMPGRFTKRRTVDGTPITYYHYFRRDIFFEVMDIVVKEIDARFPESSSELLIGISCLSPKASFSNFDAKRLLRLAELYPDDFDSKDRHELIQQLGQYIAFVKSSKDFSSLEDIGDLAKKMIETKWHAAYRLVFRLVELALILPVATATVERSFSSMKFIKNDLRNKMGDELLSNCLLCYVENETFASIENEVILQRFQSMASRRLQLSSIGEKN